MKQSKLALSAVMIVAIGLTGANFVTGSGLTDQEKLGAYSDSSNVYGHVTVIHSDPDGNILSYAQTDNLVANLGKDCMAELIFGGTAGATCEGTASVFNTIALFDGQSFPTEMNATGANNLLGVDVTASGLTIIASTDVTENTAATGANYVDGTGSLSDIAHTFTAGATQTVDGAALFNDLEDAVLAGQTFSSVTLNNLDTLAVTWTITLG